MVPPLKNFRPKQKNCIFGLKTMQIVFIFHPLYFQPLLAIFNFFEFFSNLVRLQPYHFDEFSTQKKIFFFRSKNHADGIYMLFHPFRAIQNDIGFFLTKCYRKVHLPYLEASSSNIKRVSIWGEGGFANYGRIGLKLYNRVVCYHQSHINKFQNDRWNRRKVRVISMLSQWEISESV